MVPLGQIDIFQTKGIEYLIVIGYLLLLVPFWIALNRSRPGALVRAVGARLRQLRSRWFRVPGGVYFHRGHTWAVPEGGNVLRVGMDDFAHRLVGVVGSFDVPAAGTPLRAGEPGWALRSDAKVVGMLSPVAGDVVTVNEAVLRSPALATDDPYGEGWLLRVRVRDAKAALATLLTGERASAWMDDTVLRLQERMGLGLGVVMQDGGVPVSGFAKQLEPESWDRVAAEFLLTAEERPPADAVPPSDSGDRSPGS